MSGNIKQSFFFSILFCNYMNFCLFCSLHQSSSFMPFHKISSSIQFVFGRASPEAGSELWRSFRQQHCSSPARMPHLASRACAHQRRLRGVDAICIKRELFVIFSFPFLQEWKCFDGHVMVKKWFGRTNWPIFMLLDQKSNIVFIWI